MNNLFKEQFKFFKYYSKTTIFTLIILFLSISSLFFSFLIGINRGSSISYFELATLILGHGTYFLTLMIFFFINTYALYRGIVRNDFFKTRFKDKMTLQKKLLTTIIFQTVIIFIINYLILLIGINVFANPKHGVHFIQERGTYDLFHMLFYVFRFISWIGILSLIQVWLFSRFSEKGTVIISLLYFLYIFFYASILPQDYIISSFGDIKLNISYFLIPTYYSSFIYEVLISMTYILLFALILKILYSININKKKILLFFKNIKIDLIEIMNSEKKVLIFYFLAVFLFFIYFYIIKDGIINIAVLKNIVGLNYKESKYFLVLMILLSYQVFFAYIAIKTLTRKIELDSSSIFLRTEAKNFIFQKLFSIGISTILIKTFSYIILYIFFMFSSSVYYSQIINLFIIDLIFSLTIQMFNVLCFLIYSGFQRIRYIIVALIVLEFYVFTTSIVDMPKVILFMILIIETYIIVKLFQKRFHVIFEEIDKGA